MDEPELVQFSAVKVGANDPKIHFAQSTSGHHRGHGHHHRPSLPDPDEMFNERWRKMGISVEDLKSELSELMVLCDIENHNDEQIVPLKAKLVSDVLELAIKIDNNNRPTRAPFDRLVARAQTYIKSLNDDNNLSSSAEALLQRDTSLSDQEVDQLGGGGGGGRPPRYDEILSAENVEILVLDDDQDEDGEDDDRRSNKSGTSSRSGKSQAEQIIEEFADLQINEFAQLNAADPSKFTNKDSQNSSETATSSSTFTTTTELGSFTTTVVSREIVNTAKRLVASSSLSSSGLPSKNNPFAQLSDNNQTGSSQVTTSTISSTEANPFSSISDLDPSNPNNVISHHSVQSTCITTSSTKISAATTVISTDLFEVKGDGSSISATAFDRLLGAGLDVPLDEALDDDDLEEFGGPSVYDVPPPSSLPEATSQPNAESSPNSNPQQSADIILLPDSGGGGGGIVELPESNNSKPKSEMFIL